jgi:hypothetical protein
MLPTPRLIRRALAVAGLCLAAAPAVAAADSIVFVKDSNVWLARPDGTDLRQVTKDGSYDSPYRSPSQADDGTIAVAHGQLILRMRQSGAVLNRLDPPPLMNSVSHPMDGAPVDVAISPDGSRIAYAFAGYECGGGTVSCMTRYATGYTAADHLTPPEAAGTSFFHDASWVTNSRTLQFGGFGSQVNIDDVGPGDPVHWFDDADYAASSEDLGDGEVSPDGMNIALVRSYGANAHIMWWRLGSSAKTGSPSYGDPSAGCATGRAEGIEGPTWSPDSTALAWREKNASTGADEIWVKRDAAHCDVQPQMVIPGGSEPDWGPADVNPDPAAAPALSVTRTRLGAALAGDLKVRVTGAGAGKRVITARRGRTVVARGTTVVRAGRTATVRLRFTPAGKRALRRTRVVKLTISGAGARTTVTLRR